MKNRVSNTHSHVTVGALILSTSEYYIKERTELMLLKHFSLLKELNSSFIYINFVKDFFGEYYIPNNLLTR